MLRFVVRRLLLLVPILIGLSILVFFWIRALPGSPATTLLGERATPEAIAAINEQYGLNDPIHEQYWAYLKQLLSFDFGDSVTSRRPVFDEFLQRFPATIELAVAAMFFSMLVGVPLGFLAAKRYGGVSRPVQPRRLAARDLDPDLRARDHPQVHLRRPAWAGYPPSAG